MRITEHELRNLISTILLERKKVVSEKDCLFHLEKLKRNYKGQLSYLKNNLHGHKDLLGYSIIISEDLWTELFKTNKGRMVEPPKEFTTVANNKGLARNTKTGAEKKYYIDYNRSRWSQNHPTKGKGSFPVDIDRIRTNKQNEDSKFGGFLVSEDVTDMGAVKSGKAKDSFIEFVNHLVLALKDTKAGKEQDDITKGMNHLDFKRMLDMT